MSWAITRMVIIISLLLFTGLAWWLPNVLLAPAMKLTGMDRHDPDYYIENFTVTSMNQRGTPKYKLDAVRLTHFPGGENTRLDRPHLVEYGDDRSETITTADKGLVSENGKKLLMTGNVKVTRAQSKKGNGSEITTDQLTVYLD